MALRTTPFFILSALGFFFHLALPRAASQQWEWARQWSFPGAESADALLVDADGTMWLAGAYAGPGFAPDGNALPWQGAEDVFLARLAADGEVEWAIGGGSSDGDETAGLAPATGGGVFWAGIFWDAITVEGVTLTPPIGGRSAFLFKLLADGDVNWAISLYGTASVSLGDLASDESGAAYLCGTFSGELTVGDTTLTAVGERDLFVAKFTADGSFAWATRFGEEGTIRPTAIQAGPQGSVYVGGHFRGIFTAGADLLAAETQDEDGFLLKLDELGQPLWARKAGAQYDDFLNDLVVDEDGNATVTGTFLGVLALSDDLVIQTAGFNDNFFLAHYNADGEPLWARSLGGQENEQGLALAWRGSEPVVAGLFRNQLELDGLSIDGASNTFNGFAAGFTDDGQTRWLIPLPGTSLVLPTRIAVGTDASVLLTGGFQGAVTFDDQSFTAEGSFDVFLAKVAQQVTPATSVDLAPFRVFPNPTTGPIEWSAAGQARILDAAGRVLWSAEKATSVDLSAFPNGVYFLEWQDGIGVRRRVIQVSKIGR